MGDKKGNPLTEAEQNRLIIEHIDSLVPAIVADYRGGEVEYEDLLAAGREGLVKAARNWDPEKSKFTTWATTKITSELLHATRIAAELTGDSFEKIYEHDVWGNMGNARAIYELWADDDLEASPEDLAICYDEIKDRQAKFGAAFMSLTVAQRKLVTWVFLTDPAKTLAQAAREMGISYLQTSRILSKALKTMRTVIDRMEANSGGITANRHPLSTGRYGFVPGLNAA